MDMWIKKGIMSKSCVNSFSKPFMFKLTQSCAYLHFSVHEHHNSRMASDQLTVFSVSDESSDLLLLASGAVGSLDPVYSMS